ncbi:MAG TPA: phytoene/squalene synthase family protein [SAR202 cluster bacterium]|jgi:farnesyl-diphosphate farnesyltransferase|nr:phytoene/squalene synthase family protein [SAR202 cluster bacterium]
MPNSISEPEREQRLFDVLEGVSRTFYLSLRVLPKNIRIPVGLAYALARTVDTVADTKTLAPEDRLEHVLTLRRLIDVDGDVAPAPSVTEVLSARDLRDAERRMFEYLPEALELVDALSSKEAEWVRAIVTVLSRGMEFDLEYFPAETSGQIRALGDWEALDQYTYLAAGCVGEFWTAITMLNEPKLDHWDGERMSEIGVRFGKALQFTNVLRDIPSDLRIGRCYLSADAMARAGVNPPDLFNPQSADAIRPVLVDGIRIALEHYATAVDYVLAIPRSCVRLRLAAAWPVLIGLKTLQAVASNPEWLNPSKPARVSRGSINRMVGLSFVGVRSDQFMRTWFRRLRRRVERAL